MSRHQDNIKLYSMPEIIPAAKLKLVPWEKDEEFLIVKKARKKLIVTGLREYLACLKTERAALGK